MPILLPKIHTKVTIRYNGWLEIFTVPSLWEPRIPEDGLFQVSDAEGVVHVMNARQIVHMRLRPFNADAVTPEEK